MLSEGRIEADGTLACAYHGWRFDGEGKCTTLPQTLGAAELDKAISNKKSCAQSYPVQVSPDIVVCILSNSLNVWHRKGCESLHRCRSISRVVPCTAQWTVL